MTLENLYKQTDACIPVGLSDGGMCVTTAKGVDRGCSNFASQGIMQSWTAQLHRFVKLIAEGRGVRTAPSYPWSAD